MVDAGRREVDAALSELEKRVHSVYTEAYAGVQSKTEDYFRRFEAKDKIKKAKVQAGKITQQEYDVWRKNQLLVGDRWKEMSDVIAEDLSHANQIAMSMANEFTYDAYAMGRNYGYYSTLVYGGGDLNSLGRSFTLYDKRTVERLARDNPQLLPSLPREKLINISKDKVWNKQKMTSQLMQGILTGDGPKELAARLRTVTDMDEVASLRNARTMAVGAQNAGRRDSYKAAVAAGLNIRQQWLATIDGRTRDSHRHMDGEIIKVGDKWHHYTFSNGCRFPGDPEGPPHEVYNCRCTLIPVIGNMDGGISDLSKRAHDASVTSYEEWKRRVTSTRGTSATARQITFYDGRGGAHAAVVSVEKDYKFHDGTSYGTHYVKDADVYTLDDGTRIVYPHELDLSQQPLSPEQLVRSFYNLPEDYRDRIQKQIVVVDYINPQDSYWERTYGMEGFRSYATGGDTEITFYAPKYHHDDSYVTHTLAHEGGHYIDKHVPSIGTTVSDSTDWSEAVAADLASTGFDAPSDYARDTAQNNPGYFAEDFADSCAEYVQHHDFFTVNFPNRTKILEGILGHGKN